MILSVVMHIEICVLGGEIVTDKSVLEEIEGKCVERVVIIRCTDSRFYREAALESKTEVAEMLGLWDLQHGVDVESQCFDTLIENSRKIGYWQGKLLQQTKNSHLAHNSM